MNKPETQANGFPFQFKSVNFTTYSKSYVTASQINSVTFAL